MENKLDRSRRCANPECWIIFTPINPKAVCHCQDCRNRRNYLFKLGMKAGIDRANIALLHIYAILKAHLDNRMFEISEERLLYYDADLNALKEVVPIEYGKPTCAFKVGNLVLIGLQNKKFEIAIWQVK